MAVKKRTPPVVTAAAKRINLANERIARKQKAPEQTWQKDAWAYYRDVPEVGYAVRWTGNAMAKLRLYAGTKPPDTPRDSAPVPVEDEGSGISPELAAAAIAELEDLRSPVGGQPQILRTLGMNFEVVGEAYLVGLGAGPPVEGEEVETEPEWTVRSTSEIEVTGGGKYKLKDSPSDKKPRPLEEPRDTIIRLWEPDPEWGNLADSPMRQVLGDLRALQVLSNQVIAEGMSRHNAGVFLVPNEITVGPPDPTVPEEEDGDPQDRVKGAILKAVTLPIDDPAAAHSVMPLVLFGEAQYLKEVRHVSFSRSSDESLDKRIQARVERLARGLNVPVEVVMGHMSTTFANAEQIDQDAFEDHLEARCLLAVDALTIGFLRPNLIAKGFDEEAVEAVLVWYDPSALIASPSTEAHADGAYDRNEISGAAYRKATGFSEEDAPEPGEVALRVALKGTVPEATRAAIERLDPTLEIPDAPVAPNPFGPSSDVEEPEEEEVEEEEVPVAATTNGHGTVHALARRRENPGLRLMEIDRELRTHLLVAADRTLNRALERAANRARGRQRSAEARSVRAAVEPDDLLAGAFDGLEGQFLAWGGRAQEQALSVVNRVVGGFSTARRDELKLRQAENLTEAWSWLNDTLHVLARARLLDPSPAAPLVGEIDPSLSVPPGLIRQAIARAGGAAGIQTQDGGAWITLADGGTRPAGGIGTGELVQDAMRDEGAGIEAYEWVYGPAFRARPFEPHVDLDGLTFENFDSDELANTEGWPEASFYFPGDHEGCICDFAPIIIGPGGQEG